MNNIPFFTIIIPTYNREIFLEKAINSIVNQTYYNWELIIIDDGSTDKTKELVYKFQIKDSRIIYIYQKNQERSAARNNGIKNSKGKYICFLDSDDEFKPNHLQLFSEAISTLDNAKHMLFSKYISSAKKNKQYNNYEKILKYMIHPQEVCIHKSIFDNEKFDINLNIGEDFDLWIRIVHKFPLYHINKNTVLINSHDGRSIDIQKNNVYKINLKTFKKIYSDKKYINNISRLVKKETISDCYFAIYKYHMYQNEKCKASINLLLSILTHPFRQFKHKLYLLLSTSNILSSTLHLHNEYKKHSQ